MPKVLLVEDNPGDARLIIELLREADDLSDRYEVATVTRIADAITDLEEANNYDLILSDVSLPDSSGIDTLRALNEAAKDIPVVFMTGTNNEALAMTAINTGAQDYIVKGTADSESLLRTFKYAAERKKYQNELRQVLESEKASQERIRLLAEQKQQLMKLNKSKDDFISIASHQLRTPASSVKQYIGMVIEGFAGELNEKQQQLLHKAYESNERQLNVISELLKTAQLDSSKVKIDLKNTHVNEIIKGCVSELYPTLELRHQEVKMKLVEDDIVSIDQDEFKLVLANLLENASKYSQKYKTITITSELKYHHILIRVKDQGVGINKQNQKRIFDKFSRIDNELSDTVMGSGLGLYWAKRIMKLHGGTLKVESELGKGSTFIMEFPHE